MHYYFILNKPVTPSKRHYLNIFYFLSNSTAKKRLKKYNNFSKNKILYENMTNIKNNLYGIVFSIQYSFFKNAFIASIFDLNNKYFFYMIAAKNLKIGDIIKTSQNSNIKIGNFVSLKQIPFGCPIFNISNQLNCRGKLCKAPGTFGLVLNKKINYVTLLLNSGKKKKLFDLYLCCVGIVSNELHFLKQIGKAGRSRWLGFKPKVRGVAMNPVDHKNGGGEGKKSPKNCWF